jgi:hypothetical protein
MSYLLVFVVAFVAGTFVGPKLLSMLKKDQEKW